VVYFMFVKEISCQYVSETSEYRRRGSKGWETRMSNLKFLGAITAVGIALLFGAATSAQTPGVVLYGVTGDGGKNSEELYTIDPTTAATTFVTALGNGDDGEEIAYDPVKGQIVHASGYDPPSSADRVLEWINPKTLAITPIPLSGDTSDDEITGLTYRNGVFLAGGFDNFYSITPGGVITALGPMSGDWYTGLAFVGNTLYGVIYSDQNLYQVNPSNGAIISSKLIQTDGLGAIKLTALATHPCTGVLYGVLATGEDATNDSPGSRLLVTINPTTAKATKVGELGDSFAGITFVGDCQAPAQPAQKVEERPPNIGAGLSGLFAAGPTPAPVPPSVVSPNTGAGTASQTPSVVISPPNTGDAGLASQTGAVGLIVVGFATLFGLAVIRLRQT
jgi:hypothetical protein